MKKGQLIKFNNKWRVQWIHGLYCNNKVMYKCYRPILLHKHNKRWISAYIEYDIYTRKELGYYCGQCRAIPSKAVSIAYSYIRESHDNGY